jgi:CubicO group peptidase (beta-lactamase class C family)
MHSTPARRVAARLVLALLAWTAFGSQAADPAPSVQVFDEEMRAWVERHRVANASLAVMHDDRLVFAKGYGERGAQQRVAVWSLSKAITGACIAALVQEQKLALDDPIGPLLAPLFEAHRAPADPRVAGSTVAQLLTHRGGWGSTLHGFAPGAMALLREMPLREARAAMLVPVILGERLEREPGLVYDYSNTGYLLLGQIIEVRTGEGYEDACRRRVLEPAGIVQPRLDPTWGRLLHAAGGWSLSPPEYLAFLRLLRPRAPDFLSPAMRRWLMDGSTPPGGAFAHDRAYTLGMRLHRIEGALSHTGAWNWQRRAADGMVAVSNGTLATLAADGTAWVASFDTVNPVLNRPAMVELDELLQRARRAVKAWPGDDLFPAAGVGPLAIEPARGGPRP